MKNQDTIISLFEGQVKNGPNNIAIIEENQRVTYFELNQRINQFAHYLQHIGIKSETYVALCMERSIDLLISLLAILKVGAAYIPLDPNHPEKRLLSILNDNQAPFLITKLSFKTKLSSYQGKLIILDEQIKKINKQKTENPTSIVSPEHLAYVIYTSGSTGEPKGVLIEHKSLINYCQWFSEYCACKLQQSIDFSSNFIFDMTVSTTVVPLMSGLTIVICKDELKKEARPYLKYLSDNKINIIKITPSYFKLLLQEVKSKHISLPDLETIILGGEQLSSKDCKSWLSLYPKHTLFNEYGPTETTVAVSQYKIANSHIRSLEDKVPIGKSGPNMECLILDSNNRPVKKGEIGELHVGGLCLARGYLNKPELTKDKFIENLSNSGHSERLYKTGDLCRERADGMLEFIGRIDDQIKIRGFRIELEEIEKCLASHPAIEDVAITLRYNHLNEKQLIAYFILKNTYIQPTNHELRQYLMAQLPDYMIPAAFVRLDKFPLTPNGKLDHSALPLPQFYSSEQYQKPRTTIEKRLLKIWSKELGIPRIGIEDDFFELGGHSLSAARIVSKINITFGKDLNIANFYRATTIEKLGKEIEKARNSDENKGLIPNYYKHSTLLPLNDFQFLLWVSNTFEPKAKKLNIIVRKRMLGKINKEDLILAFDKVFDSNESLLYRPLTFHAAQIVQKKISVEPDEIDLKFLSEEESEIALKNSVDELLHCNYWPKNKPLLKVKLFNLQNEITELQICMPHIIADDISIGILLAELSDFYLHHNDKANQVKSNTDKDYKNYIYNEQQYFREYLDRDINFWGDYLNDCRLFSFPSEHIIKDMREENLPYSTYFKIPKDKLTKLQQFCAKNHVSISNGLCANLFLALLNCSKEQKNGDQPIYMSIVKSTRDKQSYDKAIGCFLRLEPIKIKLNKNSTLTSLAKQVHESEIETSLYQRCSSIVKLASLSIFRQKRKRIRHYLVNLFTYLYTKLFPTPPLNRKILNLCGRLSTFERTNNFLININVESTFVNGDLNEFQPPLFGLRSKYIQFYEYDLLKIDNFLDVCFFYDDSQDNYYAVISANLKPTFRKQIAEELVQIMNNETLVNEQEDRNIFTQNKT